MKNSQDSWNALEIKNLAMALTFAYKAQNTYKEPLDLEDRIEGWKFILEDEYSIEQVLWALKKFLKNNPTMPVPADMIAILNPPKPRITEAQYVQAQKWQERNGYPVFSEAKDIIEAYNAQEQELREAYDTASEVIKNLSANSVKSISNNYGERHD